MIMTTKMNDGIFPGKKGVNSPETTPISESDTGEMRGGGV